VYLAAQTRADLKAAESRLAEKLDRYFGYGRVLQAQRTYAVRFAELRGNTIVDEDSHLAWIEAVQRSSERLGLRSVNFELEPIAALDIEHPAVPATLAGSSLRLRLSLVHEGELVQFLEQLQATAPGLMWVRYCTLESRERQGRSRFSPNTANLDADCLVTWFTVRTQAATAAPQEGSP
jgi:hypothetical protein